MKKEQLIRKNLLSLRVRQFNIYDEGAVRIYEDTLQYLNNEMHDYVARVVQRKG